MRYMPNATRVKDSCRVSNSLGCDNPSRLLTSASKICIYVVIVAPWVRIVIVMQRLAHVALAGPPIGPDQLVTTVTHVVQLRNRSGKSKLVRNREGVAIAYLNVPDSVGLAAARIKQVGANICHALVERSSPDWLCIPQVVLLLWGKDIHRETLLTISKKPDLKLETMPVIHLVPSAGVGANPCPTLR